MPPFPQLSQHACSRGFGFCPQDPIKLLSVHSFCCLFVCLTFFSFRAVPGYHPLLAGLVFYGIEQGPGDLSCRKSGILGLPDCLLISNIFRKNARKVSLLQRMIMLLDGQASSCRVAYSYQHMGAPVVSEIRCSRCTSCLSYWHQSFLQRALVPFSWEWHLETKSGVLGVLIETGWHCILALLVTSSKSISVLHSDTSNSYPSPQRLLSSPIPDWGLPSPTVTALGPSNRVTYLISPTIFTK